MKVIKNYVTILCSAAFCFSLALTGCKGKNKNGIPDGYYEVLFDTKGGTAIEHQVIKDGAKATKPADPTNPGQIFTGWYWDFEAATPFDFDTPITSTTTIYAGWELDRDSFYGGQGTADNPGGEVTPSGGKIYVDLGSIASHWATKAAMVPEIPARQGYWAYFFDGGGTVGKDWPGSKLTNVSGNVYYVNKPSAATKVIFNVNGWNGDCQTVDLTIPTDGKNLFTITTSYTSETSQNGTWSTKA